MSTDTSKMFFPFEQDNIQSLIDEMKNSSQPDQDDYPFPLFNFTSTHNPISSSLNSSNKTDNSSNSISSGDDSLPLSSLSCCYLTLQHVLSAMSSQKSAIHLQKIIREMKPPELAFLLSELKGNFFNLMIDKNGNYLCSDIFKQSTPLQRQVILREIFPRIDDIAIHEFGTHAIQTLIELASSKEEAVLICASLCDEVRMPKVALHPRGAYVVQKIIHTIPEDIRMEFNVFFMKIVAVLSVDIFGVCTVKQFALFTKVESTIILFLNIVYEHFFLIAKNKYGNYLIQFLLKLWWNKNEMFAFKVLIEKYFYELSIDEFASHIVETYVKMLNINEKQILYQQLFQKGLFGLIMNNRYGIFVVNKLMNSVFN